LFGAGTPLLPIMGSTMVITSQHLLYGFTFRRDVLPLSLRWRASLAFFLTDEMFAVALKEGAQRRLQSRLCAHRGLCLLSVLEPGDPARHRRRPVH
jgi:predicted branched-subunit amino acid permease